MLHALNVTTFEEVITVLARQVEAVVER